MSPALAAVPAWAWRDMDHRWDPCGGPWLCCKRTSADVPPTDPEQSLREEMMGCSLEVGEDAERKQGRFTASWGVGAVSLSSSTVVW